MSVENPLWGAPRIHGELLKLGFAIAQSSVANPETLARDVATDYRKFLELVSLLGGLGGKHIELDETKHRRDGGSSS